MHMANCTMPQQHTLISFIQSKQQTWTLTLANIVIYDVLKHLCCAALTATHLLFCFHCANHCHYYQVNVHCNDITVHVAGFLMTMIAYCVLFGHLLATLTFSPWFGPQSFLFSTGRSVPTGLVDRWCRCHNSELHYFVKLYFWVQLVHGTANQLLFCLHDWWGFWVYTKASAAPSALPSSTYELVWISAGTLE